MQSKKLHIISFDIPYPPDYGGVIDVFYKLAHFKREGISVILHCFHSNRKKSAELESLCEKVFYYKRISYPPLFNGLPYIVSSRNSGALLQHLLADNAPILFEGLHTCFLLPHPSLKKRNKIVRLHNIEHDYYLNLFKAEKNPLKKAYYFIESGRLKKFEQVLAHADSLLAINLNEYNYYKRFFPDKNIALVNAFFRYEETTIKEGFGSHVLYHGNLSVAENRQAAIYLAKNVAGELPLPLVIAGKNPDAALKKICRKKNIRLVENPSEDKMLELIGNAHINLLISFQTSGVKLKLFAALYNGRHCLVNYQMTKGTSLDDLCHIADTSEEIILKVKDLANIPFDQKEIEKRSSFLQNKYSGEANVRKIMELLE